MNKNFFLNSFFLLIISTPILADTDSSLSPMYGGEDRKTNQQLLENDQRFIAKAANSFSSRAHAAEGYVERGFDLYNKNKLENSMRVFNQAWLLNADNPHIYLGFGVLLNKSNESCKAMVMFMRAHKKGLNESGFLADYAYTTSICALSKTVTEKNELFNSANKLHQQSIQTPNKPMRAYAYHAWAKSYFLQQDFANSKSMLEQTRKLGGTIDSSLEDSINEKTQGIN